MQQKFGTVQPGSSQFSLDSAQVRHDHCYEGLISNHKPAAKQLQGLAVFCIMISQPVCRQRAAALKLSMIHN